MDDELKLDAVYYPAPAPSGAISLTYMGVIFDRIHFPNVYIPRGGFDRHALMKEIERIEGFDKHDYDSAFLLHVLKVTLHAELLEDVCIFTGENGQVFGGELKEAKPLVEVLYEKIHGPPKENFTPIFDAASNKGLPDSDEYIDYPGAYYYPANAILYSARTGIPLINDNPYLPIPAVPSESIENNSALLSAVLTMECIKLLLPKIRPLQPAELKELREELYEDLRGFRIAMLKLAKELNSGIKEGAGMEDIQRHGKFLVETDVYPRILELKIFWSRHRNHGQLGSTKELKRFLN
jgi:hypothetical protein